MFLLFGQGPLELHHTDSNQDIGTRKESTPHPDFHIGGQLQAYKLVDLFLYTVGRVALVLSNSNCLISQLLGCLNHCDFGAL